MELGAEDQAVVTAWLADLRAPRHTLIAIAGGTDTSPPGIGELGEGRRVQLFYGDPKAA
jgi:hypothetical protein